MTRNRLLKLAGAAGTLGVVGVVVGISTSAAAPSHSKPRRPHHGAARWPYGVGATGATGMHGPLAAFHGFGGFGGPIHSVTVVPDARGGFVTLTTDGGTLKTVSGDSLTITEGTKSATYGTPTITVPSAVKVSVDGKPSSLGALVGGDHVTISQSSAGTASVFATDASFKTSFRGGAGMGGPGRFGGPGGWGHSGPPPARRGPTGATGPTGPPGP